MDTREIENALRGRLGPYIHYKGVFTSDHLPHVTYSYKPIIIIANTLNSRVDVKVVGHWVAFYISFYPKQHLLFFDSYGFPPHFYSKYFSRWLEFYSSFQIQEFGQQIQPDDSQKCGLYVIQFTHFVSHYGLEKYKCFFKNKFSTRKLFLNDKLVTSYFFNRIVKKKNCSQWKSVNKRDNNKRALTFKECLFYKKR